MKPYPTENIRNIALVSHSGAGKTTLVERLLFDTGVTTRMGAVINGTTTTDFEPEEIERHSSISTGIVALECGNHKLNLFDTPGYMDFIGEVNAALHVCDGVVMLVEAVAGVEVGTEIIWDELRRRGLPAVIAINKMDRDNVRVSRVISAIKSDLVTVRRLVQVQLPIGEGPTFKGVVDLISMKAYGLKGEEFPIPADMQDDVEEAQLDLIEAAAEGEDALMERYFEEGTLSPEDIGRGLMKAVIQKICVPLLFCAGEKGIATSLLVQNLIDLLPSPAERPFTALNNNDEEETHPVANNSPLAASVFKTREDQYGKTSCLRVFGGSLHSDSRVWDAQGNHEVRIGQLSVLRGKELIHVDALNAGDVGAVVKLGDTRTNNTLTDRNHPLRIADVQQPNPIFSVAIHPVSQSDTAKLSEAIARLRAEDPTLSFYHEPATHESILAGMGDVHLGIAVKKLASKFGVNVTTTPPKIAYRETITRTASAEYTHKKQTGGAGQYGRVLLRLESLDDDAPFEFAQEIFGGSVSGPFVVATEKGCRQAIEAGPMAGYPVFGVKAVIYDGKEHPVDSKEIAFQIAGREGFRKAMLDGAPAMLEPIYNVIVTVPADNMGDVISDFNTRRARVQGMDQLGPRAIVKAEVPLAEMQRYLVDLRSMTQGRGVYAMEFARYGRVPAHLQAKVVEEAKQHREE
jgi:elongation factor G